MQRIRINRADQLPVDQQQIEIVERKGLGHPDTICDALVEFISGRLSQVYLSEFGQVLHYNLDKSLLVAGKSDPQLKGGQITSPMRFVLGDRATSRHGDQTIDLDAIVEDGVNTWFRQHLRFVDPSEHLVLQSEIQPGSTELSGIFQRERMVANDTSAAVGYAPLSETERIVLSTERYLNSPEIKTQFPVIGEDIKVMAVRDGSYLGLTVAIAFVDRYVFSQADYFEQKVAITEEIKRFVENRRRMIETVNVQLNALDDPDRGIQGMYLTVTGTSAESGDSGQVGRGNNVRGLISLNRPVSNEAAAGKNPVSHIGKIYNLLSYKIADRIYEEVPGIDEVYLWLVGQIGQPVDEPCMTAAKVELKPSAVLSDVEQDIRDVIDDELANVPAFCQHLTTVGEPVC